jgi:tRNA A37 methylthiotransferase MiaB
MNRQYTRTQFLEMAQMLAESFDRPAITTDIICGFPGETDADFEQTLDVVDRVRFIHTHAFTYSARPNTAAARWKERGIEPGIANVRIHVLNERADHHSFAFRKSFLNQTATLLIERGEGVRHGRSERYFDVHLDDDARVSTGEHVRVRIDSVTPTRTHGKVVQT